MGDSKIYTGLVLSGGGARGAYEAGVLRAIAEILQEIGIDDNPYDIYAGTSVGAINAAFLLSHADRHLESTQELIDFWKALELNSHLKLNVGPSNHRLPGMPSGWLYRPLLDARGLELLIRKGIRWSNLEYHLRKGRARALLVAAFNLSSGQTSIFAHTQPGVSLRNSSDPRRTTEYTAITPAHIMASSAIPLLFPVRRLGHSYYCDGSIRFNTPIAPAIRAGADRLVIISLQSDLRAASAALKSPTTYPSHLVILGRLLNSLLLSPFQYDLGVLKRFNRLAETMQRALPPNELERIEHTMSEDRGAPYRKLDTLVFMPSADIGEMARQYLRTHLHKWKLGRIARYMFSRAASPDSSWEADWAALVLFDGGFAAELIDLGYKDARARRAEIVSFFRSAGTIAPPTWRHPNSSRSEDVL